MGALMDAFIFLILFSSMVLETRAFDANCPTTRCSHGGPDIKFPFRAKGQQPQHCGYTGFELICRGNDTILEFPSFGELKVKSINYDTNRLNLLDTKNCVSDVFLNLNLSATPFRYYFVVANYTYLNCSKEISPSFCQIPYKFLQQVPCQSSSEHHVYIVESSLISSMLPVSCAPVKTVAIPFGYSPYLYGDSFGLALTWDMPARRGCESNGGWYGFKIPDYKGSLVNHLITVLIILTLGLRVKIYFSSKLDRENETKNQSNDLKDKSSTRHEKHSPDVGREHEARV